MGEGNDKYSQKWRHIKMGERSRGRSRKRLIGRLEEEFQEEKGPRKMAKNKKLKICERLSKMDDGREARIPWMERQKKDANDGKIQMLQRMERREILGRRGQETLQDVRLEGGDLATSKRGVHEQDRTNRRRNYDGREGGDNLDEGGNK